MAFGYVYYLPRPFVCILDLIGLIRYLLFMTRHKLGLRRRDPPVTSGGDGVCGSRGSTRPLLGAGFMSIPERRWAREGGDHLCAICMCCLEIGDGVGELDSCLHPFHTACLQAWVDASGVTCPLCRSDLSLTW